MSISHEGEQELPHGEDLDEEQRRLALAGLANLDVLTGDDEEEISRFRAFMDGPSGQHRLTRWSRPRRGPALPI